MTIKGLFEAIRVWASNVDIGIKVNVRGQECEIEKITRHHIGYVVIQPVQPFYLITEERQQVECEKCGHVNNVKRPNP